jgi:hypothetical protein
MIALTLPSPQERMTVKRRRLEYPVCNDGALLSESRTSFSQREKVPEGRMRGNSGYRIIECPHYYAR